MRPHHLLALLLLTGCSFAFARGPGSVGPKECTRSHGPPVVDILILTPATLVVAGVGAMGCYRGEFCPVYHGALIASLGALVSGFYGLAVVGRCRNTPEPKEPLSDGTCEERRAALQRDAAAEPDLAKRTRMLQALPSC